jgi:hypothetical protein
MTYAEQLKHPNWQRRRLERLSQANFECEDCGSKEKTLHVHHKQYIKGRMAWEYEDEQLMALCEDCHEDHHTTSGQLKFVVSKLEKYELEELLGYAMGMYLLSYLDSKTDCTHLLGCEMAQGLAASIGRAPLLDAVWDCAERNMGFISGADIYTIISQAK